MIEIRIGDALEQLREMPPESVHCCVSSPPYWGLRDYGVDGQIGLEETPDEWCARLVEVFREVRRVLRKDGTCFVNLGDSYAQTTTRHREGSTGVAGRPRGEIWIDDGRSTAVGGLKPKDLIGQPWLLAFALRSDGWFLRDAIVWSKPNPMPESVKDRCTSAYEHVFLLTKDRKYFFDAEAISQDCVNPIERQKVKAGSSGVRYDKWEDMNGFRGRGGMHRAARAEFSNKRNMRNVWTIATEAFSEAHFATFPTELARRCILAGTSSKGVCSECGAPWIRMIEPTGRMIQQQNGPTTVKAHIQANGPHGATSSLTTGYSPEKVTTGWQPSCQCDADLTPATILDPFGGAGTTALVADRLQRNAILIELNSEYAAMARRRIDGDRGGLLDLMETNKPLESAGFGTLY